MNRMEVEVKARVKDMVSLKKKLESMGARFGEEVEQTDEYFKQKGFDSRPEGPGSWIMRIRESGGSKTLTFKSLTEVTGAWNEHETGIEDGDEARKILQSMGLINVFTLHKKRVHGSMAGFEVLLDDVKELGRFMEVALDASDRDKEMARERIIRFIKETGIKENDIEKRGYGEIMGERMGHKFHGMR